MGKVTILPETTKNPITLIGERAGVCQGADTSDPKKNYQRGMDCISSGHGRALEYVNVEMVLEGYSARVIREWYTHIGGAPTRLQASTRHIDYKNFKYITPPSISQEKGIKAVYDEVMQCISNAATSFEEWGIPREDIAMMFPLGMETTVVDKRNLRNLVDMSHQRMCSRAYHEYRQLFADICEALKTISPEWTYIIATQMTPKCQYLGRCDEKKSCGRINNS